jgi:hypothetical protein
MYWRQNELFINYPQQVDTSKQVSSDPEVQEANMNYVSILMFLKKNPSKSSKLISDIKKKFFTDSCNVKDTIDFNKIASLPDGMPFT